MPSPLAVIGIAIGSISLVAAVAGTTAVMVVSRAEGGGMLACTTSTTSGTNTSASIASGGVAGFDADQMKNAAVIVAVGKQMNVPAPGWVVAITAALQESDLVNVDHGDRDSLGLFQERPSQGWGTPGTGHGSRLQQHPVLSASAGRPELAATQRQRRGPSRRAIRPSTGVRAACADGREDRGRGGGRGVHHHQQRWWWLLYRCPRPESGRAGRRDVRVPAIGVPYEWGGNGPADASLAAFATARVSAGEEGFDCSGLTKAAYAAAGVQIPRTAQTQYNAGPAVAAGQPVVAGDLVFFGKSSRAVTHVGIAISATDMIDAPHTGAVVRIEPIWRQDFVGTTRSRNGELSVGSAQE